MIVQVRGLLDTATEEVRGDVVPRPPRVGTACGVQFTQPRLAGACIHNSNAEYSHTTKATCFTYLVEASIVKPDGERARGRAMEPAFRSLLDSDIPKGLIRPERHTKNGQRSTAIYLLSDTSGAHMSVILH